MWKKLPLIVIALCGCDKAPDVRDTANPKASGLPVDVYERILADFGKNSASEVIELLNKRITGAGNGRRERHLRCIVFLARGDHERLMTYIRMTESDPRDVMVAAEYEGNVRVRDFDQPFPGTLREKEGIEAQ